MFLYENLKCPVCSKSFEKGDDIVTCPECGTPHHRECYNACGGCKNRSLHGTDFVYNRSEKQEAPELSFKRRQLFPELSDEVKDEQEEYYEPETAEAGEETAEPAPETIEAGPEVDEIDGVSTKDIASAISLNHDKFIPKFRKNRLFNWNWSAFIFGPYYYFFRKMHIQGAVFVALEYGVRFLVSALFLSAGTAYANAFANVTTPNDYFAAYQAFVADPEFMNYMTASAIILGSIVVIHIICALLADSLYRRKVLNIVHAVDEKMKTGESASFFGSFMVMESHLTPSDMKKIMLSRQGGVNTMAPLFAIIIIRFLLFMI